MQHGHRGVIVRWHPSKVQPIRRVDKNHLHYSISETKPEGAVGG
jgi:hypothetical protein